MSGDLGEVADELYGLPAAEFTSARDRLAAEARRAGDRDLAASIKKLRRPAASAWLVNRLVRERHDQVADLLRLGAAMRDAQAQLAGDELRRLSQEGQRAVVALSREARRLAGDASLTVSEAGTRDLEDTFHAALADPAASEAVQSGRLTTALHYSGFGMVDVEGAVAVATPAPPATRTRSKPKTAPASEPRSERAAERRQEARAAAAHALREAKAELAGARKDAGDREREVYKARQHRERLHEQVLQLTDQLEQQRAAEVAAASDVRDAERALQTAARAVQTAETRLARAEDELHP